MQRIDFETLMMSQNLVNEMMRRIKIGLDLGYSLKQMTEAAVEASFIAIESWDTHEKKYYFDELMDVIKGYNE